MPRSYDVRSLHPFRSSACSVLLLGLAGLIAVAVPAAAQVRPPRPVDPNRLPRPVVVDKVVAFVGSRPITLSEVELELRLTRAAAGDIASATGLVTLDDLAGALPLLMERTVVLRGMRTQYAVTLEPGLVEEDVARMRASFQTAESWDAFLAKLELSDEEVRERRRRALEAERILEEAVLDAFSVKRDDLEKHLEAHPGMTEEQAEAELLAASKGALRTEILERKKKDLHAAIVDLRSEAEPSDEHGTRLESTGAPE